MVVDGRKLLAVDHAGDTFQEILGESKVDPRDLVQFRKGLNHADGQIRDEIYVYGSFL